MIKKCILLLLISVLVAGLSSCIVFTEPCDESHSGGYSYSPPIPSDSPSLPSYTPNLPAFSGAPSDDDGKFEDVFVYTGMPDSNCMEFKTCNTENFLVMKLTEGLKSILDNLDLEFGDLVSVEYCEDASNSLTAYALSTDIAGPNPGFFDGIYEYAGRIDNSSIEVRAQEDGRFVTFMLTEELKSLFSGFGFNNGDLVKINFTSKTNGANMIYMINKITSETGD